MSGCCLIFRTKFTNCPLLSLDGTTTQRKRAQNRCLSYLSASVPFQPRVHAAFREPHFQLLSHSALFLDATVIVLSSNKGSHWECQPPSVPGSAIQSSFFIFRPRESNQLTGDSRLHLANSDGKPYNMQLFSRVFIKSTTYTREGFLILTKIHPKRLVSAIAWTHDRSQIGVSEGGTSSWLIPNLCLVQTEKTSRGRHSQTFTHKIFQSSIPSVCRK